MDKKELYLIALAQEIRSQRLYAALAKSFSQPANAALFTELRVLEENHEAKLRQAFHFPGLEPEPLQLKEPDRSGVDLSDPAQLLQFAIGREAKAGGHYLAFAEQTSEPELKQLLLDLAAEEDKHHTLLLAEKQRILGALEWFDPSELGGFMDF